MSDAAVYHGFAYRVNDVFHIDASCPHLRRAHTWSLSEDVNGLGLRRDRDPVCSTCWRSDGRGMCIRCWVRFAAVEETETPESTHREPVLVATK